MSNTSLVSHTTLTAWCNILKVFSGLYYQIFGEFCTQNALEIHTKGWKWGKPA